MDTETFLIVFAFMWGGWMLFKIHRRRGGKGSFIDSGGKTKAAGRPVGPPPDRAMPRTGKPGTVTFNQMQALRHNNFNPDRQWSFEEAALILDTLTYLRSVCSDIADDDDGPPPLAVQNELLRFILTEQDLRDYVRAWGERRREAGEDGDGDDDFPELPRNRQYDRVAEKARSRLTP